MHIGIPGFNISSQQVLDGFKTAGKAVSHVFQRAVSVAEKIVHKLSHKASDTQKAPTLDARAIEKATTAPIIQGLSQLTISEQDYKKNIWALCTAIEAKCTDTEGVFRKSGNEKQAKDLVNAMRTTSPDSLPKLEDVSVHTLAAALKKLLADNPPFSHEDMQTLTAVKDQPEQFFTTVTTMLETKSPSQKALLLSCTLCAYTLDQNSDTTKMDLSNFATSVASMAERTTDPEAAKQYSDVLTRFLVAIGQVMHNNKTQQPENSNTE